MGLGVLVISASAARAEVFVTWEESSPRVEDLDYFNTGNRVLGTLANTGLGGAVRIMIAGENSGLVRVSKQTDSLTLIHLAGGLAATGLIDINLLQGIFDANGVIHIGLGTIPDPPNDITFDGSIQIHDDGAGGGGDLLGAIAVVGCHATADDLQICLDGGNGGNNISIRQVGCTNQVDWSCTAIGF